MLNCMPMLISCFIGYHPHMSCLKVLPSLCGSLHMEFVGQQAMGSMGLTDLCFICINRPLDKRVYVGAPFKDWAKQHEDEVINKLEATQ